MKQIMKILSLYTFKSTNLLISITLLNLFSDMWLVIRGISVPITCLQQNWKHRLLTSPSPLHCGDNLFCGISSPFLEFISSAHGFRTRMYNDCRRSHNSGRQSSSVHEEKGHDRLLSNEIRAFRNSVLSHQCPDAVKKNSLKCLNLKKYHRRWR